MEKQNENTRAWVVSADMGYGHLRTVYPFKDIAIEGIISVGTSDHTYPEEQKQWERMTGMYEAFSRAKGIPLIGNTIFKMLDKLLYIPPLYPLRNQSHPTFQVRLLKKKIIKGLCRGVVQKISKSTHPLLTSFYAPAIAADMAEHEPIYCIICDSDLNRVWVSENPDKSRIVYFAPCSHAAKRLQNYGVPEERIFLTGYPLDSALIGGRTLDILKKDLAQRLFYLDPNKRFWPLHSRNVEYFLGSENCHFNRERLLTISFAVGGAGAQKEIGASITKSLRHKILAGELILNLIAGTKADIRDFFMEVKQQYAPEHPNLRILYAESTEEYFGMFNSLMRDTDILWTKPSELSFYTALGLPIIISPTIGSQEKRNKKWLQEINSGIKQLNPDYAHQWLFDLLNKGRLAEAAWAGFLKARKLGYYNILDVLKNGKMSDDDTNILR